jgi:hypothetical protein
MDQPKRSTADANAQRYLHGGDTSAERAIESVTQRCPLRIGISASSHVTQSAENDATSSSSRLAKLRSVGPPDAHSEVAEMPPVDFTAARN